MDPLKSHEQTAQEQAGRVRQLFDAVIDLGPAERPARLRQESDAEVRREVEALLEAYDCADEVLRPLEQPPPSADADLIAGKRISHYQIQEKLGGGGMGVVYKARDVKLGRTVALKFLPPHLGLDEDAKQRFIQEARAASALDHPNIGTIYEIGETEEGRLFIAMAYYEGETLKKKIARGPLPVGEALGYATQIAEALARAHKAGIVHRDVKPANVMVTGRGRVKLVDFGLAKMAGAELTRAGATMGTVSYMSPEQTRGEAVDARSDLWSLGVVLYEMLTGQRPFRGESDRTLIHAIRHDAPEPVEHLRGEVPEGLAALVRRCLAKDPDERYQTAEELLDDLRATREGSPVAWRTRFSRSRRALAYGGAALLLLLLVAFGGLLFATGPDEATIDSIAVLPVTNLSGDPEQAYFADGMTDLLINQLSQIGGFERVIARTSVMPYKETEKSPREIGRELGVEALVEASALREGERVRINVNLIEAETGRSLWGRSFERPLRGVLALQRQVARAIAQEIEVTLTPQDRARLADTPEVDPAAYHSYQRGVQLREEQMGSELERWPLAIDHFKRAVTLDSSFALAWAWLGKMQALQDMYTEEDLKPEAERAVKRALALDPNLPEAYVALGLIREVSEFDWSGAEDAFQRAIELSPSNQEAHYEYGLLLMRMGRTEEAVAEAKRALELDPLSDLARHGLLWTYLANRQYEAVIEEATRALKSKPDHPNFTAWLAQAYLLAGQHEKSEAINRRRAAIDGWNYDSTGYPAVIAAKRGQPEKAREKARAWIEAKMAEHEAPSSRADSMDRAGNLISVAYMYGDLGEVDAALDALEEAHELWPRHFAFSYLKVNESYDSLRDEPRFQALLQKVGLE